MSEEREPKAGSRWTYLDGSIRLIDAPNSRMALEIDLGRLPWDPFNALGKQVTVLIPTPQAWGEPPNDDSDDLERSLRFVVHAADRCKEFAQTGNGDKSDWWTAFQTWDWLRKHLTAKLAETTIALPGDPAETSQGTPSSALPNLPGAASVLGYTLGALRSIPLDQWEKTVSTLDPEAPSREEAIQTLLGLSTLLKGNPTKPGNQEGPPEGGHGGEESGQGGNPGKEPGSSRTAGKRPWQEEEDMSFDYANGYDEGYRLGRKVGFALGSQKKREEEPRS